MDRKTSTVARKLPAHHVILAKRIRMHRVELFARLAQSEKALRAMLTAFKKPVIKSVVIYGQSLRGLKPINAALHTATVTLRGSLRVWMSSLVRDAVGMGFRHPGDALKPIFKDNQESIVTEIVADQALFEARLSFGMNVPPGSTPGVKTSSVKWRTAGQRIIHKVAKSNLQGLTVSERIWDLTARTEQDLKRIIANQIADGESPYDIAKSIEKYVSPEVGAADELGIQTGPGVYRSAYRNAMRLARTETNRAYVQAQAAFYTDKPWIDTVEITLSPEHDEPDECDDLADGGPYSPEEAAAELPAHPHCMCSITPTIDPAYLGGEPYSAATGEI